MADEAQEMKEDNDKAQNVLTRAEKELEKLLDHSHLITTKLRENLNKNNKHRNNNLMSEEAENALIENDQNDDASNVMSHFGLGQQPSIITGGQMYEYQIEALNWMIQLYELNKSKCYINGILADDMGLGKTLMTISMIAYLKEYRHISGPHIIIVPLSTLQNWKKEFNKFCPSINVFTFHGDQFERQEMISNELKSNDFDVVITTYDIAMIEKAALNKIKWQYLVIDEAHRIKNDESKLSKIVRLFSTKYRLLVTGTPLQNNMKELWSLLNFLTPQLFKNSDVFTEQFSNDNLQNNPQIVKKLHRILRPFMLRRLKSQVLKQVPPKIEVCLYAGMSVLQKKWYKNVLSRNLDEINRKSKTKTRLLNILMQLRKVCNHPYLFGGAEEGPPFVEGAHLYENSGKLSLLDKLLTKLFAQHSRVLIFSQMTRMLDILEDYMLLKQYKYCRIDGSTKQHDRNVFMDDFNRPNSDKNVFLLSTRAGGLGINLQTADIVILYDSDWNPQMDIQAQDRAHRIGQTKTVFVYRLVTEHSVEEKILDRCLKKLYLNAIAVRKGGLMPKDERKNDKEEMQKMVTFGAEYILRTNESTINEDIDDVIKIGQQRTEETKTNISKCFDHNIMEFKMDLNEEHNYQTYEGTDYSNARKKQKEFQQALIINHGPRQRNMNVKYRDNEYYKDLLTSRKKEKSVSIMDSKKCTKRIFNATKHSKYKYDFQIFGNMERLRQIEEKRFNARETERVSLLIAKNKFKQDMIERKETMRIEKMKQAQKRINLRRELIKNGDDLSMLEVDETIDENEEFDEETEWKQIEDEILSKTECLTESEQKERSKIVKNAFCEWSMRDFNQFIKGSVDFGKDSIDEIAQCVDNKSLLQVEEYHAVFWKKYKKIKNWKKLIQRIEDAADKRKQNEKYKALLTKTIAKCEGNVLKELELVYEVDGESNVLLNNGYTQLFDRFVLVKVNEHGLNEWNEIKKKVLQSKLFWNNLLIRSKTENEIKNRAMKLLHLLDVAPRTKKIKNKKKKKKSPPKKHKKRKETELSNPKRKNLTKRFIEKLVEALQPGIVIEIFDEFTDKWTKCRIVKHCEKDQFTLFDMRDEGTFDQHFKTAKFKFCDDESNGSASNAKKRRMDDFPVSNAKRRKI